ncbi:hypothetical protein FRC07_009751 [Ceratobasidium sp. 392]|nr:hypothetical protein FRC07_009751 [Ceratobasidium sp. 392]
MAYQSRFRSSGELDDLQLAIHHETLAVESTPHASPEKPLRLSNLGISYHSRYSYLGDPKDLERAIEYDQQAVSLTPDGHTAMPRLLNSLGASYRTRFKRLGNIADIDEAIKHLDQAVSLTPSEHASYPVQLANLGEVYLERFDRLREDANLDVAIDNLNKAISLVPNGHAEMAIWLDTLGIALTRRFEHRSSLEDLNWAIKCQTQAVSLPSHEHTEKPSRLNNLGNSYHRRFKHRGELEDLQKAIECQSLAVSLIPEKHVGKPNILNSLGTSYTSRFEFSGALEDIDRAISYEGEAVDLTPNEDSSKPTRLNSLGGSYHRRFGSLREPEDLEKAIGCFEQALSYSPEGHPEQPLLLGNLGVSYELRFLVLGALPDNDKAVDYLNQAVLLSPSEDVNKAMFLSGLGGAYLARCDKLEKLSDLNKAIDCLYEATNLTPMEHPTSGYRYHDLGVAYARRFKSQIGTNADSANAIIYLNYADVAVPDGHDLKIRILTHIGDIYCSRYDKLNEQEDITQSMSHYQQAAESPTGLPSSKFTAALAWATLSVYHDAALSLKAYRRVMELLHQVVWIGTAARRRYEDLSKFANIATEVAGFAISTGEYELALEWLEQGRSMIWNQMLQLRTPLDELAAVDPKLAQELKEVANQLDQSSPSETIDRTLLSTSVKSLEKAAQGHRHLAKRWDDLLNKARQLPGMSGLLRPKRFSEIARAAESSTIVVVNIYRERCDALVIPENTTSVTHIPLADFYEQAREWHTDLISSLQHAHVRSRALRRPVFDEVDNEDRFESVLATLWDHVASPVLAHLGYLSGENTDQLPRVTWCATGPLAFLPIHAAGYYDESPSRVFDYVVSSYTPTLSSMLVLRQVPTEFRGILAVGQANTAGCTPLPGTVAELEAISAQVGGLRYTKLDREDATAGAILAEMGAHDWVHLACHGSQNSSDPTKSAFHVHGGTLELATIAHKSMKGVGLAFLSACQTATGDEKLPEEAVHLAAGMIVAGYHTVIATMWSIHDEDAPLIAEKVYGSLLKDGIPDVRRTARALHEAVGCLREKVGDKSYSRWVPYLQLGV